MESPRWPTVHVTEIEEIDGRKIESAVSSPVCDFCHDQGPCWDYHCHDFEISEIDFGSWGEWATCGPCSEMIEADDYEGLLARALDNPFGRANPQFWTTRCRQIQQGFKDNRIGERRAFGQLSPGSWTHIHRGSDCGT